MIVIGVDVHKHSLTAVAVDEVGRPLAERTCAVDDGVVEWAQALGGERLWALEDCRHVTRRLEQALVAAGETAGAGAAAVDRSAPAPQPHARQVGRDRRGRGRAGGVAGAAAGRASAG